ncbi:hypothetical protein GLYMA_16G166700v4 [Glycine max]|uniref:uncharacterized protein n=1 Tax=Glycine max TaxID=3847 RepID=UPI001B356F74|nr:uncharacterized protein LOC100775742 [Glycine max]KAH1151755.1 hypothetical protein GYH30_045313 [Glycine max]KRH08688.2 hypothetical protein GLYMA_16G166700v4 [Glycine max]
MDLKLGLKITKTRDDIASISEYRLAKAGPIFQSRETNIMFILTAHLKGYKRNNIDIKISEDGSKISISGEKPVQNILMMGWLMHRKEVDVAGFNKVFKIPDGVKLDGIKAKYDEEEWTLNIFMPKLVKGICGVRIEEIKEESERGRSELEKSEADQILGIVGEASQKGSKESNSKVQAMEDSESFMEKDGGESDKMLDDANREIIKEKIKKDVEESKLGGNGESSGEKGEIEGCEVMKTSELEQNIGRGTSQKIGDTSQKVIEESKLRIEDEGVKGMREEVGKTVYEAVKTSEKENNVGEGMPHNIGDTSHDKEFEVQEMEDNGGFEEEEKLVSEKMLDDANGNKIGEVIQKQIEESKIGIKDGDGESVKEKIRKAGYKRTKTSELEQNIGAHVTQNIGDTSQGEPKDSGIEQTGEAKRTVGKIERQESGEMCVEVNVSTEEEILEKSKQKQFGETKTETEVRLKESNMEPMKAPKLDQNIDVHIPSNIGGTSQEFRKARIQQKDKTKSIEENMDGRETGRMPVETSKNSQKCISGDSMKKDIKKPKIETEDGDQEHYGEKAGKLDSTTIWEEFPKQLPKATVEENKGLSASKMQQTEDVKEAMIKRKSKEIEYFVDKDEGEQPRRMHKEAEKDLTEKTLQESEDVREAMVKRERKEIKYVMDNSEGEKCKRMQMEAKKDLAKETTQEGKDLKEAMVKREGKETDYFLDEDEGEKPRRMQMEEKKDLTTETMLDSEDVREEMVKRNDKEDGIVEKGEGEEPRRMQMEVKKDLTKETMQESEDVKEEMAKRKGKEIEYFVNKGKGEEPKRMDMESKNDLTTETMQETKDVIEVMVKRKDKEIKNFADKSEGKEPKRMHTEPKKDLIKETMQENEDVKEAMFKEKSKETEYFVVNGEGGEPKRMHMEENKDLTTETMQESEYVKEAMSKRKGEEEIGYFLNEGEGENPKGTHMEAKDTTEIMQESEDIKEATIKKKGKETEYFVDQGEGREPKRIHTKEIEYDSEPIVKRKDKEIDYFVDKREGEELKMTHMEAKKDIAEETMQEEIKKNKNGTKDIDQENVLEKTDKGKFEVPTEELPKLVGRQDGSRGLKVAKMEEQKEIIKEAMAETECSMEKVKGEKSNTTGRVTEKNIASEILQKETEESNIERKSRDGPYVPNNMVKVVFEVLGTFQAKLPKQVMEAISQNKRDKNEYVIVNLRGEGSIKMHVEPNDAFDEYETEDINQKEIGTPKLNSSDQISEKDNVDVWVFDGSKKPKFPKIGQTNYVKDSAKIEEFVKKVNEDKYEKTQVEEKRGLIKAITGESTQTEREGSKIQTIEKDQHRLPEKRNKRRFEASTTAKEEFPVKTVDSLADKREGLKGPKIDEAKVAKEELDKQRSEEKKTIFKEKGATTQEFVKKVQGEKYEMIQAEAKEGLRTNITKGKDQQCLQEGTSRGRYEARTTARDFPMQIVDSLATTRKETKDKEIDEPAKRKSEETDVVESTIEEKVQVPESGRISMTFKVTEDKHPKVLEIESPESELQSTKGPTTRAISVEFKEVEQTSAKDKTQKTKLLPPNIQSKETHESNEGGVKQDTIKPKKEKEVEGEQCTYNIESSKEVARFSSTQQTKVEEKDKLYEGGKAKAFIESKKDEKTKDMKNIIEMKDSQESKQRKTLKPEIPLEKQIKKGEPITRKDQFAKGQKVRETMQEEIEGNKEKIDDSDQHVQRDVVKGVGKVGTTGKEMPKKEYVADVGLVAKTMETKRDLKTTPSKEKYTIAQNVKDEKPRIQEEKIKADVEKVDKKGYQAKVVEEGMSKGEHGAEVVPEIKRERPKVAKSEETKEASKLPLKREMGKTTQSAEDRKPKMGEITNEFEKTSGSKQAVEKMLESLNREHQKDSKEVTPKKEVEPLTVTPKQGVEKSKKEDMSPMPKAIQRKEPHKLSLPSKHYKIPKIEEVQHEKKGKRPIHALEATTFKKEELAQATTTHSKAKGENDEPQVNQLPSPSIELWSKESHELEKHGMKKDDSKAKSLVDMQEGKKYIHSAEGTTTSEVVADEAVEPSKFSSSPSTQPFEVEGKDKIDASHDESQDSYRDSEIDSQESTKSETDEEVEQRETLQPESSKDQQCINKDQEESHEKHEIEEEKAYEQVDEADHEDSQMLEEKKECEEEATEGKKNDQKRSKKLFVSIIIAGSALLASGIFLFIRHRRARKGGK